MHMHMLHMHMLHMHMLHMHMRMHMSCTCHARAMHAPMHAPPAVGLEHEQRAACVQVRQLQSVHACAAGARR